MIQFLEAAVIIGFVLACDAARLNQATGGEAPVKTANETASKRQDWLCLGGKDCCKEDKSKCGEGEGDCDSDSQCMRGLVCGTNNCGTFGDARDQGFDSSDDCCEKRYCYGGDNCCSNGVCTWGQGDCDTDSDCADGLVCGNNNCRHMDGERLSFDATDDCCQWKDRYTDFQTPKAIAN